MKYQTLYHIGSMFLANMLAFFVFAPLHAAVINIENSTSEPVYLQPEDSLGFKELKGKTTWIHPQLTHPTYYRFIDGKSNYHTVFVDANDTLVIRYDGKKTEYKGRLAKANEFINSHVFNARTPDDIAPYSREWVKYNEDAIAKLNAELDASNLPTSFIHIQKLYYKNIWLQQLMNVKTMMLFGHGDVKMAEGYFNFLKDLYYTDDAYAYLPNWFSVMSSTFEEMERQGYIDTTPDNYMTKYAERITSPSLRSHYLTELLQFVLKKGYTDDFPLYIESVAPYISEACDKERMSQLKPEFERLKAANKQVLRGTPLSPFTANDIQGKSYRSTDFKGKLLIIDFWFTGCVPCRAEMPYFDKLSMEYKDQPVQFLSVSLDTGNQLLAKWRELINGHKGDTRVLFLNLPNGFKNPFTQEMNIHSVPRIMLIDQQGNIVDSYAKRPSDPKLKKQIDELLQVK